MKTILVSLLGLFVLVGCGSDPAPCAGSTVLGTFTGTVSGNADTMVIADSCAITSSYCQSTSTMPNATASSGSATITVTATNGHTGCLPLGATNCTYSISGAALTFNCGGSTLTYTKQ